MTKRHRSFAAKPKVKIPLTFDVEGTYDNGKTWTESFTAVTAIPGAMLIDFIKEADSGDGGRAAQALIDFLTDVVIEEDQERFTEMAHDPEKSVEIETLAEIVEWLVEEYATRPTEPSKASSTSRQRSGRGSTATSPDEE